MTKLKFKDGVEIDISGQLRKLELFDGWYVVGQGICSPVKGEVEADEMIERLTNKKAIEPVEKDKDGNITFNLDADEANADWIRAARLLKKAKAGDTEAAAELERLQNTRMKSYTFDELNEITGGMLNDWP